jgi:hypothetical protein
MDSNAARTPVERRSSLRIPCGLQVQVRAEGMTIHAEVMNISPSGMFIRPNLTSIRDSLQLTALLRPDASLVFRLKLADQAIGCEATARVAWKSDLGIGLDFIEANDPLRAFVQRLAESRDSAATVLTRVEADPTLDVR